MTITDKIRVLCAMNKISVTQLEEELDFGNGSLTKKNQYTQVKRLLSVAKRFNISIESLIDDDISLFPDDSPMNEMIGDQHFMENMIELWSFPEQEKEAIYEQIEMRAAKLKVSARKVSDLPYVANDKIIDPLDRKSLLNAAHETPATDLDKAHDLEIAEVEDDTL